MRLGRTMTLSIALLSAAVLAVVITLLAIGGRGTPSPEEPVVEIPEASRRELPEPELILPNEHQRLLSHRFRPFREPRGSWTEEDVARFWEDPRSVTGDFLLREARQEVDGILQGVP